MKRKDCPVCKQHIDEVFTGIVTGIAAEQRARYENERCNGKLPTQGMCGWEGHNDAMDEAGFCGVCQH